MLEGFFNGFYKVFLRGFEGSPEAPQRLANILANGLVVFMTGLRGVIQGSIRALQSFYCSITCSFGLYSCSTCDI